MKAFIEQIELGHNERTFLGIKFKETPDRLDISNKPSYWLLDLFRGYKQLARFSIKRPHDFKEREYIDVDIKDGEVIAIRKLKEVN